MVDLAGNEVVTMFYAFDSSRNSGNFRYKSSSMRIVGFQCINNFTIS